MDCPEVFGRVPVSLFMAVRWSPVRTRPRKQTALAVYLKRKKTKLPGGVLPRNERAEIAFEEWCVTKRVRETVAGMLENEVPSPTSNLLVLSKRQLEHYWRQVGQVIKHTNLLWKTSGSSGPRATRVAQSVWWNGKPWIRCLWMPTLPF